MHKIEYLLLLILIVFITYIPSLFGQFVWDDEDFVYSNTYVKEFKLDKFFTEHAIEGRGKQSNYYRPIQMSLYALIYRVVGPNPSVYHAVSIFFHIGAVVAVFFLLEKITALPWKAFLIALLFGVHPVQTETVSYISGISDSLFVLCGALSVWFFLKKDKKSYYWSIIFYILALLSKETGLVFLGILSIAHYLFFTKIKHLRLTPFFLITALYLLYHFTSINSLNMQNVWGDTIYANSFVVRVLTFVHNLFLYYSLALFPKDLFMERDYTISIVQSPFTWQIVLVVLINAISIGFIYLNRKSEKFRELLFFLLGYYISFVPYSGIVLINGIFYEHFLYLPLIFFFGFLIYIIPNAYKKILIISIYVLTFLYIGRSYIRQYEWIDPGRFYLSTLQYAPKSIRIQNGLAMVYAEKGEHEKAIVEYKKIIALNPKIPNPYHNLALVYIRRGDLKTAERYLLQAIQVEKNFHYSYPVLIGLYKKTNQNVQAERWEKEYSERFKVSH